MASRRVDRSLAQSGGWVEILRVPAALFAGVTRARGFLYDRRWRPVLRVPIPVVSVGNIALGGTGKTPLVAYLVETIAARGVRVGVLARGYGRAAQGTALNEEGAMLAARFPALLQVQDPDRVRGALKLLDQGAECIVLDDGFQHRRLHRDVDLVLVDALRPFGLPADEKGRHPVENVLPRGFLREPLGGLRRADLVVVTRTRQAAPEALARLETRLRSAAPGVAIAYADHQPHSLWQVASQPQALETLRGQNVDLVSAIGNPEAFEASARELGMKVASHRIFADHHAYALSDLQGLGERPLVTTAKDFPKLAAIGVHAVVQPWVLEISWAWVRGAEAFDALLGRIDWDELLRSGQAERAALHAGLHG